MSLKKCIPCWHLIAQVLGTDASLSQVATLKSTVANVGINNTWAVSKTVRVFVRACIHVTCSDVFLRWQKHKFILKLVNGCRHGRRPVLLCCCLSTGWTTEELRFDYRQGQKSCLFPVAWWPSLWPTQFHSHWATGIKRPRAWSCPLTAT